MDEEGQIDGGQLHRRRWACGGVALVFLFGWLGPRSIVGDDALFAPVEPAQIHQAHEDLRRAVEELENYLRLPHQNNRANGQAWKTYLLLELLQRHAVSGAAALANRDVDEDLRRGLERFLSGKPGLEHGLAQAVRRELRKLLGVRNDARSEDWRQIAQQHIERLENLRKMYDGDLDNLEPPIREILYTDASWLLRRNLAPQLTKSIQQQFQSPGLFLDFSQETLNEFAKDEIRDTSPIRECVLETAVCGTSRLQGSASLLVPHQNPSIAIELNINARARSDTIGYNGPVRLFSDGVSWLNGEARLRMDSQGHLRASPAAAHVCVDSETRCIDTRFNGLLDRLVRSIARRRSERLAPQANTIMATRAAGKMAERIDKDLGERLQQRNERYDRTVRMPLKRRDIFFTDLTAKPVDKYLQLAAKLQSDFQLGAPNSPPPRPDRDICIRVHETYLNNALFHLFVSRRMTESNFRDQFLEQFPAAGQREKNQRERKTPSPKSSDDKSSKANDDPPSSKTKSTPTSNPASTSLETKDSANEGPLDSQLAIVFEDDRPVHVAVDKGTISFTIRSQALYIDNEILPEDASFPPLYITVRYQTELTEKGVKFTKVGDPDVSLPGDEDEKDENGEKVEKPEEELNPIVKKIAELLTGRFARWLVPNFTLEEMPTMGGSNQNGQNRLGKLKVTSWKADDGWIVMGLSRSGSPSKTQALRKPAWKESASRESISKKSNADGKN